MSDTTIVDTGEKLGGAVKDDWAGRTRETTEKTGDAVAELWPRPDWRALIQETSRELAAALYVIRETMIEHQKRNGAFAVGRTYDDEIADGRRQYIAGMTSRMRALVSENSNVTFCAREFAESAFGDAEWVLWSEDDERFFDTDSEVLEALGDKIIAAAGLMPRSRSMGMFSRALGAEYSRLEIARSAEEREMTKAVYADGTIPRTEYNDRQKAIRRKYARKTRVLMLADEIERVLASGWPDTKPAKGRRQLAPLPKRPRLERLERTGPTRRNWSVTPETIVETFGVRGIEFGKWVTHAERQACIDLAFDAFHDLAEVLAIEPKDIGRSRLGVGFGSRGRGATGGMAAAAHYEPNRVVINLTRMMGDGSLAHEMGHMFEHSLVGFIFEPDDGPTGRKKRRHGSFPSTSWVGFWRTPERPALLADPALNTAFCRVMDVIMKENPEQTKPWRASQYYTAAMELGAYWSAPLEMFARAFECYVHDWLAERGRVSQYLVHGVEGDRFATGFRGNPYPTGEERARISAAMATLIEVWRQTTVV